MIGKGLFKDSEKELAELQELYAHNKKKHEILNLLIWMTKKSAMELLNMIAKEYQIIYFTCHGKY